MQQWCCWFWGDANYRIVILSGVVVREEDDNSVEGPRVPRTLQWRLRAFSPDSSGELLFRFISAHAGTGSFDYITASRREAVTSLRMTSRYVVTSWRRRYTEFL